MKIDTSHVDPTDPNAMLKELETAVTLLDLVITRMNKGVSYWGDAFSNQDYKLIVDFLKKYGVDWE